MLGAPATPGRVLALINFSQPRVPDGGGRGGVHGADGGAGVVFPAPIPHGGQLKKAAVLARGRQLDLPEQRNRPVFAPDLPQGAHLAHGELAHSRAW